jgi:hypothetical protein
MSAYLPIEYQVTRAEAADLLDLSVGRVRQLYDAGKLTKYYNAQGRLRLDRREVIALRRERDFFKAAESKKIPA